MSVNGFDMHVLQNHDDILFVQAIDQDTVDSITYKFSTGDFTVFNINSNSGVITNNQLLQYETRSRYVFTVTTAEGESSNALSATATVTINIQVSIFTNLNCG